MLLEDAQLAEFWEVFVGEHWEQRPAVFRQFLRKPLITPERALASVKIASERLRRGEPAPIRFFIENALVQSRLDGYLPVAADPDFASYAKRIAPLLYAQGFGAVFNGFSFYDFELFARVGKLLGGLYERVGLPGSASDLDVFVGNYRRTPFGIHTDTASNFSVVFEGKKKFLLWPGPALQAEHDVIRSVEIEAVRDRAIVLEANAGDVVYWPSSYWHIAESDGALSGVLNIALYLQNDNRHFVRSVLPRPMAQPEAPTSALPWTASAPAQLPEALERELSTVDCAPSDQSEARHALLKAWLARASSRNFFRAAPPLAPHRALLASDTLTVDTAALVAVEDRGKWLVAAHGHVIEMPAVPRVAALLQRLLEGSAGNVAELCALAAEPATTASGTLEVREQDVRALLESLVAMRALDVAP